jgi:hypothetical protein
VRVNASLEMFNLCYNRLGRALRIAEAHEFNSSIQMINLYESASSDYLEICDQALEGCLNRRKLNFSLWVCSFIDNWRAVQSLGFDKHMLSFYFYPLLGIELSK